MQGFWYALDFCGLKDFGYDDYPFSWCNRQPGNHNVLVRLDRGVALVDWILKFLSSCIHHLEVFHFDHRPIIFISNSKQKRLYRKGHPFHFEPIWLKDKSCEDLVRDFWASSFGLYPVRNFNKRIDLCQDNLRVWN